MTAWLLEPLGMRDTRLLERPSQGLHGPLADLAALTLELLRPTLVSTATLAAATTVAFPGLVGMLPGVGRFDPLDWGLGFELRDGKTPHWTGLSNSPATFGHFGGSGTFVWVDPVAGLGLATLTSREYGPWALEAWPSFSDAVLHAAALAYRTAGVDRLLEDDHGLRTRTPQLPGRRVTGGDRCRRGRRGATRLVDRLDDRPCPRPGVGLARLRPHLRRRS